MPTRSILVSVLGSFFLLFLPLTVARAATSETHVSTESHVSSSNSTSSTTQTDIIMEVNGEKQEYHSDSGDDVTMTSKDGKSTITVTNSGTNPTSSPKPSAAIRPSEILPSSPSPSLSPSSTPQPTAPYPHRLLRSSPLFSFWQWLRSFLTAS